MFGRGAFMKRQIKKCDIICRTEMDGERGEGVGQQESHRG